MRTVDLATASVLALLGGVVLYDATRLGIGWSSDGPRSGFFPFWLAVLLVLSCAGILVQAWRRPREALFVTRSQLVSVLKVVAPMAGLVVATSFLGLYVSAAVYVAFYMRWIGRHGWPLTLVVAIGIPVVIFAIFEIWFLVPMPKGPLEAWLGY